MRILIVEDDEIIGENVRKFLEQASFAVDVATALKIGIDKALGSEYDLIILDWMLPDGDGVTLAQMLRKEHMSTPILMLTAKTQNSDIVAGLNSGADDYLNKPFDSVVLLARVRAILRRPTVILPSILNAGGITLNTNAHTVTVDNKPISLSPREYSLLEYLMLNKNSALSRADLYAHVWDEQANMLSNTVDVYIQFLRKKIGNSNKSLIVTVKGFGYKLCDP